MEITVIRHLPTEWNRKQVLQGKKDIPILPLTEKEQSKIAENLQLIQEKLFDLVLCSTLGRTMQTAEHYGQKAIPEPLLDELDFGSFEGRPKKELVSIYGELWSEKPAEIILGESLVNLETRIKLFLTKYSHMSQLLVFGHGSWIRALKSYHQYGHINAMNKTTVKNNECISLEFITVEA